MNLSNFFFQTGYFSKLRRFRSFLKLSADFFISIKGDFFHFFQSFGSNLLSKGASSTKTDMILDYDLAIINLQFGIGLTSGGF